jgi:ankyrin repeat protein
VKQLLEKGANPNVCGRNGETPIFHAVRTGNDHLANGLLEWEAVINQISNRGEMCVVNLNGNGELQIVEVNNDEKKRELDINKLMAVAQRHATDLLHDIDQ